VRAIRAIGVCATMFVIGRTTEAAAQAVPAPVALTVASGRPLDVVLDERVVIKRVGQPVTGRVIQPLYAYDRMVVPSGTVAKGHVASLIGPSRRTRIRAWLSGDFTPTRQVVLQFDTLVMDSGDVPIQTLIKTEIPHVRRTAAPPAADDQTADTKGPHSLEGNAERRAKAAIADAKQRGRDVLDEISRPGRMARLKDALVQRLPYHPQIITAGTGYHAELVAPLAFGTAVPIEAAPPSVNPARSSRLSARLLTDLDSSTTPRGTPITAAVTEPVFSADHQLILPEGTLLDGEVTFAKPARRLHRNGQLRFLFETVHRNAAEPAPLLASLQAVETSDDAHLAIDDEGGTSLKNPKTRFIAPALAVLALRGNLDRHEHPDPDGDGHMVGGNNPGAAGAGGFLGLGVLGIGLSQISRPMGLALSVVGAVRTLYTNVLGKGREVQFPADTMIQLQLAPGPGAER